MIVTTEHLDDELLQRHFDGDLDRAAASTAQAHLASCDACAARQRGLERLHLLMGAASEGAQQEADFAGLYDRIEAGIGADAAGAATDTKVVELASRRRMRPMVAYVVTAAAAAAAVVITVFHPGGSTPRDADSMVAMDGQPAATTPQAVPAPGRSEVVNVDFGTSTGTVFEISLADGSSTPVVWINDDE